MLTRRALRIVTLALAAGALGALGGAAGCMVPGYHPGGSRMSRDMFTYISTPDWPQTVSVVDLRSGEAVWVLEVPVGEQLVVQFLEEHERAGNVPALMRWDVMTAGTTYGRLDNSMPVPPATMRRLDVQVRRPEIAQGSEPTNAAAAARANPGRPSDIPPGAR